MLQKLSLFFNTIKYLKLVQIYYQVYYLVLNRFKNKPLDLKEKLNKNHRLINYSFSLENSSFKGNNIFQFLNIKHQFQGKIDWEYLEYGKLWQYNLAYFDYLNDSKISDTEGIELIDQFLDSQEILKSSIEPYPTSLRLINWIRFLSSRKIIDNRISDAIFIQAKHLFSRLEYHLLGNHLLENAFCLLHLSKFFSEEQFYTKSKNILFEELEEQILDDGGHFELSPMYHQIIFFRVLEAIDLLKNNFEEKDEQLLSFLSEKASNMLSWLETITFSNGDIPLLNDAANGIAPTTAQLKSFASTLKIKSTFKKLKSSGYRKFENQNYEAVVDIGKVGPSYQPGHAHADMLNLIIYYRNKPFLVETGTSTYQINPRRHLERSTESHNTVVVNGKNQSQVWSGFRVARRAKIKVLEDKSKFISAQHNGFVKNTHRRDFTFNEKEITIVDTLLEENSNSFAYWHFHPEFSFVLDENQINFEGGSINFENCTEISTEDYYFASQFNRLTLSKKIKVRFNKKLLTRIYFGVQ